MFAASSPLVCLSIWLACLRFECLDVELSRLWEQLSKHDPEQRAST